VVVIVNGGGDDTTNVVVVAAGGKVIVVGGEKPERRRKVECMRVVRVGKRQTGEGDNDCGADCGEPGGCGGEIGWTTDER